MASFSVHDVLLGLKQECETLRDNWQGEVADKYMSDVMDYYINYVTAIEKCLQGINQGLDEVYAYLDDDSEPFYEKEEFKKTFRR